MKRWCDLANKKFRPWSLDQWSSQANLLLRCLKGCLGVWGSGSRASWASSLPGQGWLSWSHNIYMEELWSSCVYPSIALPVTGVPNLLQSMGIRTFLITLRAIPFLSYFDCSIFIGPLTATAWPCLFASSILQVCEIIQRNKSKMKCSLLFIPLSA